jgi:hypothetical protein
MLQVPTRPSPLGLNFQWTCSADCSCLPPQDLNIVYFHTSYKTANESLWPEGWSYFFQEWQRLHPNVTHILWLDQHNELLAKCHSLKQHYDQVGKVDDNPYIGKADYSRGVYMLVYGGFYHDMDFFPLRDQLQAWTVYNNATVLLQGRLEGANAPLSLEWCFTRVPGHALWKQFVQEEILDYGPLVISTVYEKVKANVSDVTVVPGELVNPLEWDFRGFDQYQHCPGEMLRGSEAFYKGAQAQTCFEELRTKGAYVMSSYSASWTPFGLKPKEDIYQAP